MNRPQPADDDLIDVLEAARLAGRSPETIRRWIWAGRLPTRRRGNRHLMSRDDVAVAAGTGTRPALTLADWARAVRGGAQDASRETGGSAADLVLEDRRLRSVPEGAHGRRR